MSRKEVTNHFLKFVKAVISRPGMFLVNNVEDLTLIIFGYKTGISYHMEDYVFIDEMMNEFKKYINIHFKTNEDIEWARLIRFHCVSDAATLDFFNFKFNEFISEFEK
ncbi:hypothetical protein [Flavihumibacter sp. CACIAM 22H1]|uniref:hypothetical protein n=1 Tax=Flavihumibacter sp. CACIAM 22H1 TaxID=1812911 RepID=UPI0007A83AC1|nr:hypothetical protein [Flavihumibacter sp. CACIAM 22H1]KYP16246.1 MAG: hypothetical protein A1D16_20075 [Flavihumibacter sp. CACIAM 22H1]